MRDNLKITVKDGDIELALRQLKRNIARFGISAEIRRHDEYSKPSVRKRVKSLKARKRARKAQKRIAAAVAERELLRYGSSI